MSQIPNPQEANVGDRMVTLAMQLMQEVKTDIGRMNDKLDEIAKERRDEAREHGGLEVRISTLEETHRNTRALVFTLIGAGILGLVGWVIRTIASGVKA